MHISRNKKYILKLLSGYHNYKTSISDLATKGLCRAAGPPNSGGPRTTISKPRTERENFLLPSERAKPPKRKYVNYKELMQKRKEEKLREKEEKQQMVSKTILQNVGKKKKNKGTQNDVGHFLSGYGTKKDLKKNEQGKKTKKRKQ